MRLLFFFFIPTGALINPELDRVSLPNDELSTPHITTLAPRQSSTLERNLASYPNRTLSNSHPSRRNHSLSHRSWDEYVPISSQYLSKQHCYARDAWKMYGPVDKDEVMDQTDYLCWTKYGLDRLISKGDPNSWIYTSWRSGERWKRFEWRLDVEYCRDPPQNFVKYKWNIYWKSGCESKFDPVDPNYAKPEDPREETCLVLLRNNFFACDNGGRGGWIQMGCVVFDFQGGAHVYEQFPYWDEWHPRCPNTIHHHGNNHGLGWEGTTVGDK